ncbi:MAG: NUDIX domain-containing protein [Alphaproteobacteria bacterium]|nr:NUDIX domain-containing protein [Alphaproteobacteria bacterium]MBL6936907.1 NUDIX domain-containing protein [Alphaproteobacteria bacterium]MBL7097676.1 NUDIX domain-containing protein [Alphaproteobacteria bacterium]
MPAASAGVLLWRRRKGVVEVFLIHPGGPFWRNKDAGAWSIPKGLIDAKEDHLAAARREFTEETGFTIDGDYVLLGRFRQSSAKMLTVYAVEGDCDPAKLVSNTFELEWPPKSGRKQAFPEADRGAWFAPKDAAEKILKGQLPLLNALADSS